MASMSLPDLIIRPMTDGEARAVAEWRYEEPYTFYDMSQDAGDLRELLDPTSRRKRGYHSALDPDGGLVGFLAFRKEGETVDIGLGLRPDLTGRGLGLGFLEAGLRFAEDAFRPRGFRLAVAAFNERAIRVYGRAGFHLSKRYLHETNGGVHEFVEMVREARPQPAVPSS
jgi:[ribosomal protein S18]-alanine N-acetyltransferase